MCLYCCRFACRLLFNNYILGFSANASNYKVEKSPQRPTEQRKDKKEFFFDSCNSIDISKAIVVQS
jgi:hypothetical protein